MTHFPEVIGWTLLHFIWQATVIAVVYQFIDWRLKHNRTDVRYSMVLAAILCMLGTSITTLVYEHMRLGHAAFAYTPNALEIVSASAGNVSQLGLLGSFVRDNTGQLLRWVDCAWFIGVFFFALRALGGVWKLSRFRSMLSFDAVGDLAARFSAIAQGMALKNHITLRIHPSAEVPFVAGLFRSVIYLPISALTSLTPDQLDTILIHELAHVRRADYAWNLLQSMMETLFFFHPAVWWLGGILRERRELCCDDIVLEVCSNPFTYAKALLALAEQQPVRPRLAMALDGHQGRNRLFARIARILGETCITKAHSGSNVTFRLLISFIAGAVILYGSFVISLSSHVPVVRAEHATQMKESPLSPVDAPRIQPDEVASRLRSTLVEMPDKSDTAIASDHVTSTEDRHVQLVAFSHARGQRAISDSTQNLNQQLLPQVDASETHEHHHNHQAHEHHHHHHHSLVT